MSRTGIASGAEHDVSLRYKDWFLFKMRHTELHSKVTLLCQAETMGPGAGTGL